MNLFKKASNKKGVFGINALTESGMGIVKFGITIVLGVIIVATFATNSVVTSGSTAENVTNATSNALNTFSSNLGIIVIVIIAFVVLRILSSLKS